MICQGIGISNGQALIPFKGEMHNQRHDWLDSAEILNELNGQAERLRQMSDGVAGAPVWAGEHGGDIPWQEKGGRLLPVAEALLGQRAGTVVMNGKIGLGMADEIDVSHG